MSQRPRQHFLIQCGGKDKVRRYIIVGQSIHAVLSGRPAGRPAATCHAGMADLNRVKAQIMKDNGTHTCIFS